MTREEFLAALHQFAARLFSIGAHVPDGPPKFGFRLVANGSGFALSFEGKPIGRIRWKDGAPQFDPPHSIPVSGAFEHDHLQQWVGKAYENLKRIEAIREAQRYYSGDDPVGITPSQLEGLDKDRQLEYAVFWFNSMFLDPAEETPYDEGEYVWIYGGPYDAEDELYLEFAGILSADVIRRAAEEVTSEGTHEWAPSSLHPDQQSFRDESDDEADPEGEGENGPDDVVRDLRTAIARLDSGTPPDFGAPAEQTRRKELEESNARLRAMLAESLKHPMLGHNNPPEEDCAELDVAAAQAASEAIWRQLQERRPDARTVAVAALGLATAQMPSDAEATKPPSLADSIIRRGKEAGKLLGEQTLQAVIGLVLTAAAGWLFALLGLG